VQTALFTRIDPVRTAQKTLLISVIKTNQLALCGDNVAILFWDKHKIHKYSVADCKILEY